MYRTLRQISAKREVHATSPFVLIIGDLEAFIVMTDGIRRRRRRRGLIVLNTMRQDR